MWHFCSRFLIILFKIIIWAENSQMLGLLLKNKNQNKEYVVKELPKHQSDFFFKDIWETKSLIYSIRFPQPKSFRGGKLDDNTLSFL